jgi:hypothetical protein
MQVPPLRFIDQPAPAGAILRQKSTEDWQRSAARRCGVARSKGAQNKKGIQTPLATRDMRVVDFPRLRLFQRRRIAQWPLGRPRAGETDFAQSVLRRGPTRQLKNTLWR